MPSCDNQKTVSRYCQMFPRGQNCSQLRTTRLHHTAYLQKQKEICQVKVLILQHLRRTPLFICSSVLLIFIVREISITFSPLSFSIASVYSNTSSAPQKIIKYNRTEGANNQAIDDWWHRMMLGCHWYALKYINVEIACTNTIAEILTTFHL